MLSARKLALALQFARDEYANTREEGFFIDAGTVIVDVAQDRATYTDDDEVVLTYENGEKYRLVMEKMR